MDMQQLLAVTNAQALRFFFERLKNVAPDASPVSELLYNASVLAHFATTSTTSTETFPPTPASLTTVLDVFILDQSGHVDAEIMEAAGSQCLLLTGFFAAQQRRRHNLRWYAAVGVNFYTQAAAMGRDRARSQLMKTIAGKFGYWRLQQARLARELHESSEFLNSMIIRA